MGYFPIKRITCICAIDLKRFHKVILKLGKMLLEQYMIYYSQNNHTESSLNFVCVCERQFLYMIIHRNVQKESHLVVSFGWGWIKLIKKVEMAFFWGGGYLALLGALKYFSYYFFYFFIFFFNFTILKLSIIKNSTDDLLQRCELNVDTETQNNTINQATNFICIQVIYVV